MKEAQHVGQHQQPEGRPPRVLQLGHARQDPEGGRRGTVLEGQYACNGEAVRVSPRYQRNGQNYRVRPERPAAFFAAFLYESGVLPHLLTSEECEQEWALALLDPLWEQYRHA